MVWTNLFGVVSFEVFGQLHNVVGDPSADRDAFFAECVRRWITFTPITYHPTHPPPRAQTNAMNPGIHGVRTH